MRALSGGLSIRTVGSEQCGFSGQSVAQGKEEIMMNRKRGFAIAAVAAAVAAIGFGGALSATAGTAAPADTGTTVSEPTQGQEQDTSDGPNVGPDANADEPGHQDASEAGDSAEESTESEAETSDGPNVGPDANADEPGHQDASDAGDPTD